MGYDYRGGGIEADPHMAQAIKVIRAGGTPSQMNRALLDKAIMAGIGAGLTGVGGAIQGHQSEVQQKNAGIMAGAIHNQTALAGQEKQIRDSAKQYASPDYTPPANAEAYGQAPDWLVKDMAKDAKDTQAMNGEASMASIGGHYTPAGLDSADGESDVRAADLNTGKNLMRTGGMMSSLPRTR